MERRPGGYVITAVAVSCRKALLHFLYNHLFFLYLSNQENRESHHTVANVSLSVNSNWTDWRIGTYC